MLCVSLAHYLPHALSQWQNPFFYFRVFGLTALASAAVFALMLWPARDRAIAHWLDAQHSHNWRLPLTTNLTLFGLLLAATLKLGSVAASGNVPSLDLMLGYNMLVAASAFSLLRIDVPVCTLLQIACRNWQTAAVALTVGCLIRLLSYFAQDGWETLAGMTLHVVHGVLALYETDVAVDLARRAIQVDDFEVTIATNCSGYEGIALTTAFLSVYLWTFRAALRFPRAFLLLPIGIVGIWLLNALRIVALVSLGVHVSPAAAVQGFHSQAGWIAFLMATFALMALAHNSKWFSSVAARPKPQSEPTALAFLAPFIALMSGAVLMAAAAPREHPFYIIKFVAVTFAVWHFRTVYRRLAWTFSYEGAIAGLLVGALWVATDPHASSGSALADWLSQQSPWVAIGWLIVRAIGSTVLIPIAEELAFRGFVYRRVIAPTFETVSFGQYSRLALAISSAAFGLLHDRWLAAGLSGAVFTLVMCRTKTLSAAVVAHAAANVVIFCWAVVFRQWSLLG